MKFYKNLLIIIFLIACNQNTFGQNWLEGFSQKWDNNIKEWTILTDSLEGELRFRWKLTDGTEEWDYRISDEIGGSIRQVWGNDRTQWEIRANGGEIISIKTMWNNDLSEWRITNNEQSVRLRQKWTNDLNEWSVKDDKFGKLVIGTEYQNDYRDWEIFDDLSEDLSIDFKFSLMFIVMICTL